MKRFVALTLAVILALAMMVSAAALPSPDAHEYYYISVNTEGSGNSIADVNKIEVGTDGTVTLTATNDLGYFTRWIIDGEFEVVSGSLDEPVIVIRPRGSIDATASFSKEEDYLTMTVEAVGNKNGTATVDIEKVLKGSDTVVTFTATEGDDEFVEWQLHCEYDVVEGDMKSKVLKVIPKTDIHAIAYFKTEESPEPTTTPTEKPDDSDTSPKTGDALPYVIVLMILAAGAAVLAAKKLKAE